MPHVSLQISGHPDTELMRRAVATVGELTQRVLGKGRNAFQLDISVTDETNTKAEKAEYLKQAFAALSEVIGDVNDVSYIYVIDARAAAYGYGGKTQEFRHQHR